MNAAQKDCYERIQRHLEDLPALSPTVTKVLQIVNNPDASANDLIQVIKLDPVLTAQVLRLINSPFFGMSNVSSVGRALVAVGFNTVKNLVLSSALAGIMAPGADQEAELLWSHSLAVGVSARCLARAMNLPREEQEAAFIAGLMHDLGKILLQKHFKVELAQIRRLEAQGVAEIDAERTVLGVTHEAIGGMLGRKWKFPPGLVYGVEFHHSPVWQGTGAVESCLTCLSNAMYYRLGFGSDAGNRDHAEIVIPPGLWRVLGLNEAQVRSILAQVPEEVDAARQFLGR